MTYNSDNDQEVNTVLSDSVEDDRPQRDDSLDGLDDLIDPDSDAGEDPTLDSEVQKACLCAILRDYDTAKFAASVIKPSAFSSRHYKTLASITFEYVTKYGQLPSDNTVYYELRKELGADKAYLAFAGDAKALLEYTVMDSPAYIQDLVADFAKRTSTGRAINKWVKESAKTLKPDYNALLDAIKAATNMRSTGPGRVLSLSQIRDLGESIDRTWIAENWLQAGHLVVLSGREKRGKTTCLLDLYAAILSGGEWLGAIKTSKVPILLLDYENPIDYLWHSIKPMLTSREVDIDTVDNLFHQIHPDDIRKVASPLSSDYAVERIKEIQALTGIDAGLLVVDTASPAWSALFDDSGWTNQSTSVRKALETAQQIARDTGWCVVVIHHDNKSGTGAAGSYEWYGTPDCYIRYERGEDSPIADIKITGRLAERPEPLRFSLQNGRLLTVSKMDAIKSEMDASERANSKVQDKYRVLSCVPVGKEQALSKTAVVEKARTLGISKHTAEDILSEAVTDGDLYHEKGLRNATMVWADPDSAWLA